MIVQIIKSDYESITYTKDKVKRKIALNDKYETLDKLIDLLKQRLNGFPKHRLTYNITKMWFMRQYLICKNLLTQ